MSKKSVLALAVTACLVSGVLSTADAGFFITPSDPGKPQSQSLTDAQDNARLRTEVARLTNELANVQMLLENSRKETATAKDDLLKANKKLDEIQGDVEKLTLRFAFASTTLNSMQVNIDKMVALANKARQVDILGFSDNVGTYEANLQTATARAVTVKNLLINKGISAQKITAKGKTGEFVGPNETAAGRAANRRVEVTFSK